MGNGMEERSSGANEVMFKMATRMLRKRQENGLINEEEYVKINALNIETFSPKFGKVYL